MLTSATAGLYIVLARIFVAGFGCAAVIWGLSTLPIFWQQAFMERIAHNIIRGEKYKIEVLMQQIPIVEAAENSTICRPIALWSAAIIRLRMVEQTGRNGAEMPVGGDQMKLLNNSIRRSLSCSPAESFLWLALYSVESAQNGFKAEYLKYLKMSYELGPNEGWVALKRNPVVFVDYKRLPSDLFADAINEFVTILNYEFFQQAVEFFSGFSSPVRDAILPHLVKLPLRIRETFASAVYNRGLDVTVPGVEPPSSRPPWH